jgi:hypothetical protein
MKYLLFDIAPNDSKQHVLDYIKLITLLLIMAVNEVPNGSVRKNRVYRAEMVFDDEAMGKYCTRHIDKLQATLEKIRELERELKKAESVKLDNSTSQELFESEESVPVLINAEYKRAGLMAKYSELGLAKDCPTDEYHYWYRQYYEINKLFIRYLREPRRAVKTATKESFREKNIVDDERILLLSEYQKEDIVYKLLEEEQKMIDTGTTHLFDSEEYTKRFEEADKEIRRGIKQRMTRNKTLVIGGIALGSFLIGFLPLLYSNMNDNASMLTSLQIIGISSVAFLLVGLICLFVLRKQLVNRFKHFNYVMSGICNEIDNGLSQFSKYLGHACNVMREFSILNYSRKKGSRKHFILKKHELDIREKIDEVGEIFSQYIPEDTVIFGDNQPYNYDFTIMKNYEYDMPSCETVESIEYMQRGNQIKIPVDYVKEIKVRREEIYD